MVQRRGAKLHPARPTSVFELSKFSQRYKYYMYYIRVEAVGFSGRNHPPLPPAINTMNFRFSHATYEKAPTLQWRQCGAFVS